MFLGQTETNCSLALCICDFGTGVNRPEDAFLFNINGEKHNLCMFSAAD